MMNTSLLDQMKMQISAARGRWPSICKEANVEYVWLFKVMQGRIKDPGVSRVERVMAALNRLSDPDATGISRPDIYPDSDHAA